MRTRNLFTLALSLAMLSPLVARAQEEGGDEGQETEEGGETEGVEVAPPTGKAGPTTGGKETAPGEVHTVVKGDTLWDLSQRYLGNAWYWPKVWSYNPEIANPHWIYPGNQVRFFPDSGGEEAPTQVEQGEGPPGQIEEVEPGSEFASDVPDDSVEVAGPIGVTLKAGSAITKDIFMTPREVEEAGTIDSSFREAEMLSYPDTMYVKFKGNRPARGNERYLIFRTEKEIVHPKTGFRVGYMTHIVGEARTVKVGDKLSTLQIVSSSDEIHRGDLIGPYGENLDTRVMPRAATQKITAMVLSPANPYTTISGEHHSLIIDKGSADGVQPGYEFIIIRRGDFGGRYYDPSEADNASDYPWEDVGICMAVDVKESATTCLLRRSLREIVPGDRLETRPVNGGAVSRR